VEIAAEATSTGSSHHDGYERKLERAAGLLVILQRRSGKTSQPMCFGGINVGVIPKAAPSIRMERRECVTLSE